MLRESVEVRAPIERCFALSTNLAIVEMVLGMRPVGGRRSGSVIDGDTVRWHGWMWGLAHEHESAIEAFEPPVFFRDRMIAGRFAAFEHDHNFTKRANGIVLLHDELRFALPWGMAGRAAARMFVIPRIQQLMRRRFALIKELAEGDGWRRYVEPMSERENQEDDNRKPASAMQSKRTFKQPPVSKEQVGVSPPPRKPARTWVAPDRVVA